MKVRNLSELTESLFEVYSKIDSNEIGLNQAKVMANVANAALKSIQVRIEAIKVLGEKSADKLLK